MVMFRNNCTTSQQHPNNTTISQQQPKNTGITQHGEIHKQLQNMVKFTMLRNISVTDHVVQLFMNFSMLLGCCGVVGVLWCCWGVVEMLCNYF